jgi:serine/threonine protein phosphatase PrpC
MKKQEDRYFVKQFKLNSAVSGWILAVMDGHTHKMYGEIVSERCKEVLEETFQTPTAPERLMDHTWALYDAIEAATRDFIYQGSTLSLAIILESHERGTTLVLGDSPIVRFLRNETIILPVHNVLSNLQERKLANERGGIIESDNRVWVSQLNSIDGIARGTKITRGLGSTCMEPLLSHYPDVEGCQLVEYSALLLCTDGFLDPNQEYFEDLMQALDDAVRVGDGAEELLEIRQRFSELTDNATLVLWSTF